VIDTQHAIDPEKYRHEWENVTPRDIFERVSVSWVRHVTLTGGEPFLQPSADLELLVDHMLTHCRFNIFTNGTLPFPRWIQKPDIKVIMDWKLPGSGEQYAGLKGEPTRLDNIAMLGPKDSIKFVCVDKEDFWTAHRVIENHPELFKRYGGVGNLYLGAAWSKLRESQLVEWLKANGNPYDFKLNVQVHNFIYDREERGI
jgi:7-carboxy-7-deazaguanine synthase